LLELAPPPAAHEPAAAAVQLETILLLGLPALVVLLRQVLLHPTPQHGQHLAQLPQQQGQHLAQQALAQLAPTDWLQCCQAQLAHQNPERLIAGHAAAAVPVPGWLQLLETAASGHLVLQALTVPAPG
jgi:hypothetical protein